MTADRRNAEPSERPAREHPPNGNNLTFKWLAGILLSLLLIAGAAWAKDVNDRVREIERDQSATGERLARIEASQVRTEADVAQILQRLSARSGQ